MEKKIIIFFTLTAYNSCVILKEGGIVPCNFLGTIIFLYARVLSVLFIYFFVWKKAMQFFDTHAHIGLIYDDPIEQLRVVQEAKQAQVTRIVSICNSLHDFTKVYDKRTKKSELGKIVDWNKLAIDIFPLDAYPEEKQERENFHNEQLKLLDKYEEPRCMYFANTKTLGKKGKINVFLAKTFLTRVYAKRINKHAKKYEYSNASTIGQITCIYYSRTLRDFDKELFKPIPHKFEDKEYMIPSGYDTLLKNFYGDYMIPPPPEKRVSTHGIEVYLEQE